MVLCGFGWFWLVPCFSNYVSVRQIVAMADSGNYVNFAAFER